MDVKENSYFKILWLSLINYKLNMFLFCFSEMYMINIYYKCLYFN